MLWTDKAKKYIKKYWGIDELKPKQIEVMNALLLGNDVIGLLPTGYGKSLCYILPPLIKKKTMIIVSPLISLMEDQVIGLKNKHEHLPKYNTTPTCCLRSAIPTAATTATTKKQFQQQQRHQQQQQQQSTTTIYRNNHNTNNNTNNRSLWFVVSY